MNRLVQICFCILLSLHLTACVTFNRETLPRNDVVDLYTPYETLTPQQQEDSGMSHTIYWGACSDHPWGVQKNDMECLRILLILAEHSYIPAQEQLAKYYVGKDINREAASFWLTMAISAKTIVSMPWQTAASLATLYMNPQYGTIDYFSAFYWKCLSQPYADTQLRNIVKNASKEQLIKSIEKIKDTLRHDTVREQMTLAGCYRFVDINESIRRYESLVAEHERLAAAILSEIYLSGETGKQDIEAAIKWAHISFDAGAIERAENRATPVQIEKGRIQGASHEARFTPKN